jgi:hypothetical protein
MWRRGFSPGKAGLKARRYSLNRAPPKNKDD